MFWKKQKPDTDGYHTVAQADDVQEGDMLVVKVNRERIILTYWQGELFAFSNNCPHASADLSDGELHRGRITCLDHDYKFDIRTGRTLWPEDEVCRLKKFVVKIEDGAVKVKLT